MYVFGLPFYLRVLSVLNAEIGCSGAGSN